MVEGSYEVQLFTAEESLLVVSTLLAARTQALQSGDLLRCARLDRIGEKLGMDEGWFAAVGPADMAASLIETPVFSELQN